MMDSPTLEFLMTCRVSEEAVNGIIGELGKNIAFSSFFKLHENLKQFRPDANHEIQEAVLRSYIQATLHICIKYGEDSGIPIRYSVLNMVLPKFLAATDEIADKFSGQKTSIKNSREIRRRKLRDLFNKLKENFGETLMILQKSPVEKITESRILSEYNGSKAENKKQKWIKEAIVEYVELLIQLDEKTLKFPGENNKDALNDLLGEKSLVMQAASSKERQKIIRESLLKQVEKEIAGKAGNFPDGFRKFFRDNWYNYFCGSFQYQLSQNNTLAIKFQTELLAGIETDTKKISYAFDRFKNVISNRLTNIEVNLDWLAKDQEDRFTELKDLFLSIMPVVAALDEENIRGKMVDALQSEFRQFANEITIAVNRAFRDNNPELLIGVSQVIHNVLDEREGRSEKLSSGNSNGGYAKESHLAKNNLDDYIEHFYFGENEDDYRKNIGRFIDQLNKYIKINALVDRLREADAEGDKGEKIIRLFEHGVKDVELIKPSGAGTFDFSEDGEIYTNYIEYFLSNTERPFFILGEPGSGKTALCYFIFQHILQKYLNSENKIIPIYIPLYHYRNPEQIKNPLFAVTIYTDLGNASEELRKKINDGQVLFIFDGLDELDSTSIGGETPDILLDLFNTYPNCPKIVTSRTPFYRLIEQKISNIDKNTAEIKELTKDQQNKYITNRLGKDTAAKTIELIETVPNLFDLAPTIVLLEMIVNIVSETKEETEINKFFSKEIRRKDIYEKLVSLWSKSQASRISTHVTLESNLKLVDHNKQELVGRWLNIISLAMFHYGHHGGLIIYEDKILDYIENVGIKAVNKKEILHNLRLIFSGSGYEIDDEFIKKFNARHNSDFKLPKGKFDNGEEISKALEEALGQSNFEKYGEEILDIAASKSSYTFNHKTILEYLVARTVVLGLSDGFQILEPDAIYHILSERLDRQDDEVIEFIKESIPASEKAKINRKLIDIIYDSEERDSFDENKLINIRNNGLKILAFLNDHCLMADTIPQGLAAKKGYKEKYLNLFVGKNFSGLKLSNCNLSNHNLTEANFSNANLKSVNFAGANLYKTNLAETDLIGAYEGQSMALWSLEFQNGFLYFDRGDGSICGFDYTSAKRDIFSSSRERNIWDLSLFKIKNKTMLVAGQHGNTLQFYSADNASAEMIERKFRETIFAVQYNAVQDLLAFGGTRGNIYLIKNVSDLLEKENIQEWLEDEKNLNRYKFKSKLPENYLEKYHDATVFGITFSDCGDYLVSCGADNKIKIWSVDYLLRDHKLSDVLKPEDVYEVLGEKENRIRKIKTLTYDNDDYFIAGTQKGWLIVLKRNGNKLEEIATIEDIQKDWVLDIESFVFEEETYVAAVSGDFSLCIWNFAEILENQASAEPEYKAEYISALLSITSDKDENGVARLLFAGSYDGNIIIKNIKEILETKLPLNDSDEIVAVQWDRTDASIEMETLPDSFVSDATNANITGVSGLNKGRLLMLKQRGAFDLTDSNEQLNSQFSALNELQKSYRRLLVEKLDDSDAIKDAFGDFLKNWSQEKKRFEQIIKDVNNIVGQISDPELKDYVINLYQNLTATKVTLASVLMVFYWFSDETWRTSRKVDVNEISDCKDRLFDSKDSIKKDQKIKFKERLIYEKTVENIRKTLEDYFSANNRADFIFDVVYEDYQNNNQLKDICDFLAGSETERQIPDSLPNIKIENLWTEINNKFWTGNSKIAKSYFDSFVENIYRCCGETQKFLIENITAKIKNLIAESDKKIIYWDLATGFNGTILVGVYENLSEAERERVEFNASDSSEKIVYALKKKIKAKNWNINVEVKNLVNPSDIPSSIDIISQNLGAHHLPQKHQEIMYKNFVKLLTSDGYLCVGDVFLQPLKILAGLPDDIGAPESPYDCRELKLKELNRVKSAAFPELGNSKGFYTCQIFQKVR